MKNRLVREIVRHRCWSEAGLRFYMKLNQKFRRKGESIFIACAPKSGSTFLAKSLARVTGFTTTRMNYAFGRSEQELYFPKMIDAYALNTVTQQHLRANTANLALISQFEIRPVILVRNLFDTVVSIRDHLLREGPERFPSIYATETFAHLEEEEQFDFVVANAMPWYFNFFASWWDSCHSKQIDALWLTYEGFFEDCPAGLTKVLEFYGIKRSIREVQEAIETVEGSANTRLNVGRVGRGKERLTSSQQIAVSEFAKFYPRVDFSSVGLGGRRSTSMMR